jgi:signal transduction histidine kinase
MFNKLLNRQLHKHLGELNEIPENYIGVLRVISESYDHYEKDRKMLERSIDLSSNEMIDLNSKLKKEADELKKAHFELKTVYGKLVRAEIEVRKFAKHIHHVLEEERLHIAKEIHDEFGQKLAGIKMGLSSIEKQDNTNVKTKEKINGMMEDVDMAIQSLRKIVTELRPGILDTLGLIPSIEWLFKEFKKKTNAACKMELSVEELEFEKNISTCFFRICQEALTNISKHAEATEVNMYLSYKEDTLMLKIIDNGKGIPGEKVENPLSEGLLVMRERANIIGADLEITSKQGSGTTVLLRAKIK